MAERELFEVAIERKVMMAARDGVSFAMDIYRPARAGAALEGAFPVLLERTPYDRGIRRIAAFGQRAAASGYIFISQDVRGRGDSGGRFEMMTQAHDEGADGADTMDWIIRQPWCNGKIGTLGGSYSATNQQAAALHHPKGLRAQVLRDCGTNYYRRSFRVHGAFNVGITLAWIVHSAGLGREALADPRVKAAIDQMKEDLGSWVARLPLKRGESPLALVSEYESTYFKMLEISDDVDYWHSTGLRMEGRWDQYPVDVAVLLISGWFATHSAANFDKFRDLRARLERPVHLIVGPWIHSPRMLEDTHAGSAEFGPAASRQGPIIDVWLQWMDRWVRDIDNGIERQAPVRYFVMGSGDGHRTSGGRLFHGGEWRSAEQWPIPDTVFKPFYLTAGGALDIRAPVEDSAPSTYVFDPADPYPGIGSVVAQLDNFPSFVLTGPQEQRCRPEFAACRGSDRPLSERPDVLVFETEPLEQATEVTGPIEVFLWVATSARDTDFTVKLIDVYPPSSVNPDGYALYVTEGILRMRYRDDRPKAELMEPGTVYAIRIELGPTSNLFKKGHRLRLDISSSSFPQYDVNPNTGEPLGHHTRLEVAQQTVFHDARRPSHILLPLQPDRW